MHLNIIKKRQELENVLAQFELASNMYFYGKAYCYEHAFGTNMNGQKAFELYQDAADLGNVFGIYNLGRCYRNGIGISVNIKKALELYQKQQIMDIM
ncbi:unnamed protein product [Rhizophagus irregularis]|nr:unnamed protein product [Rhizophagus irregularis]